MWDQSDIFSPIHGKDTHRPHDTHSYLDPNCRKKNTKSIKESHLMENKNIKTCLIFIMGSCCEWNSEREREIKRNFQKGEQVLDILIMWIPMQQNYIDQKKIFCDFVPDGRGNKSTETLIIGVSHTEQVKKPCFNNIFYQKIRKH